MKGFKYLATLPNARSTVCYFRYKESYEPAPGNMANLPRACYGWGRLELEVAVRPIIKKMCFLIEISFRCQERWKYKNLIYHIPQTW